MALQRTEHIKFVTYGGDGNGRDHYIIFNNGGLNDLNHYKGPSRRDCFSTSPQRTSVTARKESTAVDYIVDGSGRDTYILNAFGLKRNYKSPSIKDYQMTLRAKDATPIMDHKSHVNRGLPMTTFTNWQSPQAYSQNKKVLKTQRASVERLTSSPSRVSPLSKYMNQTGTFDHNPTNKASGFLLARGSQIQLQNEGSKTAVGFNREQSDLRSKNADQIFGSEPFDNRKRFSTLINEHDDDQFKTIGNKKGSIGISAVQILENQIKLKQNARNPLKRPSFLISQPFTPKLGHNIHLDPVSTDKIANRQKHRPLLTIL